MRKFDLRVTSGSSRNPILHKEERNAVAGIAQPTPSKQSAVAYSLIAPIITPLTK